jgi:phospholipase C
MENAYGPIKHIVVLMLENRSFDNILGSTFEPDVKRSNSFYPPGDEHFPIPIPAFNIGGRNVLSASIPTPDPGEHFQYINQQIFGLKEPPPIGSQTPAVGPLGEMGGFVQNYYRAITDYGYPKLLLPTIMNQYSETQLPVTTALGKAFAVLDNYHASAPCQTMPNRCFAEMGTALGRVNNDTYDGSYNNKTSELYIGPTIFNHIDETDGVDWRVYFGDFPLTLTMVETWPGFLEGKFHFFDQFQKDVETNSLPSYSWIEPAYQLFPTDNHPPHDINLGEYLLEKVYNTLRANPETWESTLLVVTYDEHGGCYDHVFPPTATPDGDNPQFAFDRYGVRVPTLLISPYIQEGTIGTPSETGKDAPIYDHTSILKTVRNCFSLNAEPLSNREKDANDFSKFLTLGSENLNMGPESVSVGMSKEELERQAIVETISSLGQLWWDSRHTIPQSLEEIEAAVKSGSYQPKTTGEVQSEEVSDADKIEGITASIKSLFGRAPVGLFEYK